MQANMTKKGVVIMQQFRVGMSFRRTCIFSGGVQTSTIIKRDGNHIVCSQVNYEQDGVHNVTEEYDIFTDNKGEYIVLWKYHGESCILYAGFDSWGNPLSEESIQQEISEYYLQKSKKELRDRYMKDYVDKYLQEKGTFQEVRFEDYRLTLMFIGLGYTWTHTIYTDGDNVLHIMNERGESIFDYAKENEWSREDVIRIQGGNEVIIKFPIEEKNMYLHATFGDGLNDNSIAGNADSYLMYRLFDEGLAEQDGGQIDYLSSEKNYACILDTIPDILSFIFNTDRIGDTAYEIMEKDFVLPEE